jgi:thioredoxin 1
VREVTDATFAAEVLDAPGPTIVDFWAPWCKPCKAIEPLLEAIAAERGVRLVRIDIDEHLAVPGRYGVLSLPTVILFADGEPRATVVGARPRGHFERAFEEWLPAASPPG